MKGYKYFKQQRRICKEIKKCRCLDKKTKVLEYLYIRRINENNAVKIFLNNIVKSLEAHIISNYGVEHIPKRNIDGCKITDHAFVQYFRRVYDIDIEKEKSTMLSHYYEQNKVNAVVDDKDRFVITFNPINNKRMI